MDESRCPNPSPPPPLCRLPAPQCCTPCCGSSCYLWWCSSRSLPGLAPLWAEAAANCLLGNGHVGKVGGGNRAANLAACFTGWLCMQVMPMLLLCTGMAGALLTCRSLTGTLVAKGSTPTLSWSTPLPLCGAGAGCLDHTALPVQPHVPAVGHFCHLLPLPLRAAPGGLVHPSMARARHRPAASQPA